MCGWGWGGVAGSGSVVRSLLLGLRLHDVPTIDIISIKGIIFFMYCLSTSFKIYTSRTHFNLKRDIVLMALNPNLYNVYSLGPWPINTPTQ